MILYCEAGCLRAGILTQVVTNAKQVCYRDVRSELVACTEDGRGTRQIDIENLKQKVYLLDLDVDVTKYPKKTSIYSSFSISVT
jgi:hypothetical protein